jgi:F0F1-type ATP synthase assembly protein I
MIECDLGAAQIANSQQDNRTPLFRKAGLYLAIGLELPGTVLAGLLVGYLLDSYFATSPWLLLTLGAIAFIGAMARLIYWARILARERDGIRTEENHPPY